MIRFSPEKWGNGKLDCYKNEVVECVNHLEIEDLSFLGASTHGQTKRVGTDFVSKKLDRVRANLEWMNINLIN